MDRICYCNPGAYAVDAFVAGCAAYGDAGGDGDVAAAAVDAAFDGFDGSVANVASAVGVDASAAAAPAAVPAHVDAAVDVDVDVDVGTVNEVYPIDYY